MAYEAVGLIEGRLAAAATRGTTPATKAAPSTGTAAAAAGPRTVAGAAPTGAAGAAQQLQQLQQHEGEEGTAAAQLLPPASIDDFRERAQLAALLAHVRSGAYARARA